MARGNTAIIIQLLASILCIWVIIVPNLPRAIIAIGLMTLTALDNGGSLNTGSGKQ